MKKMNKPLKNVDSAGRTAFLRAVMPFFQWGLITLPAFIYYYGILGFFLWLLIILSLGIIVDLFTDKIGDIAGRLYTGRKADWSIREKSVGTMSEVRVQKMKGNFDQAFIKVEEILTKDKYFPDALLTKSQILYEQYNERIEALKCLDLIIEKAPETDPVLRWARKYKQDIINARKN